MAFSQSTITDVSVVRNGAELSVSWSASTIGNIFQVYVDRRLAWHGVQQFCSISVPFCASARNVWIEVGTVSPGDMTRDYSTSLSCLSGTGDRVLLLWYGGTYLASSGTDDIDGYTLHASSGAGGPVDFTRSIGSIPAYPSEILTDGYGMGDFGLGGFGRAATSYQWRSGPLSSGTWDFAVVPHDRAGNVQSSPQVTNVTLETAPLPPGVDENGGRLSYLYSGTTSRVATLNWIASPS